MIYKILWVNNQSNLLLIYRKTLSANTINKLQRVNQVFIKFTGIEGIEVR